MQSQIDFIITDQFGMNALRDRYVVTQPNSEGRWLDIWLNFYHRTNLKV